jgi:hypothetical protein
MRILSIATAATLLIVASPALAATVIIDLSGATTGTTVTGVNATFAQTFAGQTVVGTGISGTPTNPLTLAPAGSITVAFFSPGVSAASNSLLSQPDNSAPLSVLLGSLANSFTFTMGSASPPSTVSVRAFAANGSLTGSTTINTLSGYNIYALSGLGNFAGLTFYNITDDAGVRFQNMSYNSVAVGAIPEPATWMMMLAGFGAVGFAARRRQRVSVTYA